MRRQARILQIAEQSAKRNKVVKKPFEQLNETSSQQQLIDLMKKHRERKSQKELTVQLQALDLREKSAKRQERIQEHKRSINSQYNTYVKHLAAKIKSNTQT